MSTLSEEKLIEMLTQIQSDIRQITFDLDSLVKQQSKPMPPHFPDRDDIIEESEAAAGSTSVEEVLRFFVRSVETMIWGRIRFVPRRPRVNHGAFTFGVNHIISSVRQPLPLLPSRR